MTPDDDGIPRSVKPREVKPAKWLPIIAFHDGLFLIERTGEIVPFTEARNVFLTEPPSIVVTVDASGFVSEMDDLFSSHPQWQYRVTPLRQEIFVHSTDNRRAPVLLDSIVSFFGFRHPVPKKPGKWFHPLDPLTFTRLGARAYLRERPDKLRAYLQWGQDVREFTQAQGLKLSTTGGGLAGQLLRDPRFYPNARRKVPRQTNALARICLPGNFYKLYVEENEPIPTATYLDLKSAHHHAAANVRFPHADHLMRRGDWGTTDPTDSTLPYGEATWTPGSDAYKNLLTKTMGLLKVRLRVPELPPTEFAPPYLETPGLVSAFIYTNEIPYILKLGASIEGIDAAWTGHRIDNGLNRYAVWAMDEVAAMSAERRQWAKPVLLSAYGVLAAKPKMQEVGFRQANGGDPVEYPAGSRVLKAYAKKLGIREPPIANVIQRGMIEAETRIAALTMARLMNSQGHRVLSIYADAVFIEPTGGALTLLPRPWEVKGELTRLTFHNATSFTSDELRKLPGIVGGARGTGDARRSRSKMRGRRLASVRPPR